MQLYLGGIMVNSIFFAKESIVSLFLSLEKSDRVVLMKNDDCLKYGSNITLYLLIFIVWLFSSLTGTGILVCQNINLKFQHLQAKDGLDNRYNDFIYKDSKGFVWISSTNGLYRFDGINLKNYPANSSTGLLGSNIQSNFIEDQEENIWFSTYQAVNCYVRASDSFVAYQLTKSNGDLISTSYNLFYIEQDSVLWLNAGGEIYRYVPKSGNQISIGKTEGVRFTVDTFLDGRLKSIIACPWINKSGIEMFSLEKKDKPKYHHFFPNGLPSNYNQSVEISKAIIENDSLFWLFSNMGLLAWNPRIRDSIEIFKPPFDNGDFVKDGAILDAQYLLVTTKNSGLWVFDKQNKVFSKNYSFIEDNPQSIGSNALREISIDKQEHLWLSNFAKASVDYTWLYSNQFKNQFSQLTGKLPVVNSIAKTEAAVIWCSTERNGLFKFMGNDIVQHYPYLNENKEKTSTIEPIKKLVADKQGRLWALSRQAVYLYNDEEWILVFKSGKKLYSWLSLNSNRMIVATNEGLFELKYDSSTKRIIAQNGLDQNGNFDIPQLFPISNSTFYASAKASDLLIYKLTNGECKLNKEVSVGADVYAVLEDKSSNTVLLSTSNGLWQLDLASFEIVNFFEDNESLKNAPIYATFRDQNQHLWIATNQHFWKFDAKSKELSKFGKEDGLLTNEFSLYANALAGDGKIWVGTADGAVCFDPDSIQPYPYVSKIYLKSLLINNEQFDLNQVIDEIDTLDLKHHENTLEFEVIGITNYFPKSTSIHYQLEGYNQDWKIAENDEVIQFIKIPPGNYALKLFSSNINQIKSEIRKVAIIIQPPFWQTAWFLVTAFLGLLLLSYGIFKVILKRKLQQQQLIFDALSQERNRIAGEMHDDLGGGLYSIKILIGSILKKAQSPESPAKLTKIKSKADELLGNMREIVWALDGSNDNLSDLVAYIRQFFVEFLNTHSIPCTAQTLDNIPEVIISGEKRRDIFLCIKECVLNVAKHSEATKAELLFTLTEKNLIITIKDNGKGFDETDKRKFGNGLKNMKNRMEQIGGKYKVSSNQGTATTFEIPIAKNLKMTK